MIAFDTETDGLDSFKGARPFVATLATESLETSYIDLQTDDTEPLRALLLSPREVKIAHNLKFDWLMLQSVGYEIQGDLHDTMIMAHVYDPNDIKKLKWLGKKYLNREPVHEATVKAYIKEHNIDVKSNGYRDIPRNILEPYAVEDVVLTMELFKFYEKKGILDDPTYKTEMKLLRALVDMQTRGVLIDVEYCKEQSVLCDKILADIEEEVKDTWRPINLGSNKQLSDFLFGDEQISCDTYNETGNPCLDGYHIQQYNHPIVPLVIKNREIGKLNSTYFKGLIDRVDSDNVIHCDFFQVGAKTGRFSCQQPNLQNISKKGGEHDVRRAFICRAGFTNYYFDYSQIELRVLAHYSKDERMIATLTDPNGDIHSETCMGIFGEITKPKRDIAKRINFGIVYGMGANKLTDGLRMDFPEAKYTYNDSKRFIGKYHMTYPKVKPFSYKVQRTLLQRGYIHDVFGRKYVCDKEFSYRSINYLIQGCAAGILKQAMIDVYLYLLDKKSNLLLTIHDEIVVEVHKSEESVVVPAICRIMEDRETFRVPITINVERTETSWKEKTAVPLSNLTQ